MSIRVKFDLEIQLSETTMALRELGDTAPWAGTNDQQDNGGTWRQRIVAGAANVLVDLNGLTNARFLAIKSDQTITVKKNDQDGEAWTIRPLGVGATYGVMVITTDEVDALYLSNDGETAAEVTFLCAGVI